MSIKDIKNSNNIIINKKRMIQTAIVATGAILLTGVALNEEDKANTTSSYSQEVVYNIRDYESKNVEGKYLGGEIVFKSQYTELENEIADSVIRGNYGNGEERKQALEEAGYDYGVIQSLVNLKCNGKDYIDPYWDFVFARNNFSYKPSETKKTLAIYNKWLETIGSPERLTPSDIEIIESNTNEGIISIKNSQYDNYSQVGEEYLVVENTKGEIELLLSGSCQNDLLTDNKREKLDYTILSSFGEYIEENELSIIGFTLQKYPAWSDKDVEFIRENYSEDVLECLKENGFPLPCYDAADIYKAHEESKSDSLNLELKQ